CRMPSAEAAKSLETERGYFRRNAERMRYATYRDQGLPVGSGVVESAVKHLVQHRMKRAGMRWSELALAPSCTSAAPYSSMTCSSKLPDSRTKVGYTHREGSTDVRRRGSARHYGD